MRGPYQRRISKTRELDQWGTGTGLMGGGTGTSIRGFLAGYRTCQNLDWRPWILNAGFSITPGVLG